MDWLLIHLKKINSCDINMRKKVLSIFLSVFLFSMTIDSRIIWMEGRQTRQRILYEKANQIMADSLHSDRFFFNLKLMSRVDECLHLPHSEQKGPYGPESLSLDDYHDTLFLDFYSLLNAPMVSRPQYIITFSRILGDTILLAEAREWEIRRCDFWTSSIFCFYFDMEGNVKNVSRSICHYN